MVANDLKQQISLLKITYSNFSEVHLFWNVLRLGTIKQLQVYLLMWSHLDKPHSCSYLQRVRLVWKQQFKKLDYHCKMLHFHRVFNHPFNTFLIQYPSMVLNCPWMCTFFFFLQLSSLPIRSNFKAKINIIYFGT